MEGKSLVLWFSLLLLLLPASSLGQAEKTFTPPPRPTAISAEGQMSSLTLEDAVLLALNRNQDLRVQILEPKVKETLAEEKKADFDFGLSTQLKAGEKKSLLSKNDALNLGGMVSLFADNIPDDFEMTQEEESNEVSLELSKLFSSGTRLSIQLINQYSDQNNDFPSDSVFGDNSSRQNFSSASLNLNQPLLQGRGRKVNLSFIEQANIDQEISLFELQQYIMEMVAKVQKTYWDLVLSHKTLAIHQKSLELVGKQLEETQERINVGKLAQSELVSAQAEVAAEKQKVIDAESLKEQRQLELLLLLNPELESLWEQDISLTTAPAPSPLSAGVVREHVLTALKNRPDLHQAHLNLQKGDLEVIRTENGLLPKLDFFFSLKRMSTDSKFPSSLSEFEDSDYEVGLKFTHPLERTRAENQYQRANLQRMKYLQSIAHLEQKIEVEVRKAILEIKRYDEQIIASQANQKWQEEKLKVEQEQFRLGRSTNLLVFQAQRDLIAAQVNEVTAIISQLKASIDLQLMEGTLLEHWSIDII